MNQTYIPNPSPKGEIGNFRESQENSNDTSDSGSTESGTQSVARQIEDQTSVIPMPAVVAKEFGAKKSLENQSVNHDNSQPFRVDNLITDLNLKDTSANLANDFVQRLMRTQQDFQNQQSN